MTPDEMWIEQTPEVMTAGVIQGLARRANFAIAYGYGNN